MEYHFAQIAETQKASGDKPENCKDKGRVRCINANFIVAKRKLQQLCKSHDKKRFQNLTFYIF